MFKMKEKELIKQLSELRNIKPNDEWAVSARADIVRMVNEDTISSTRHSSEGAKAGFSFLFSPLPRLSFSLVPIFALLLILSIGLFPARNLDFGGLALKNEPSNVAPLNIGFLDGRTLKQDEALEQDEASINIKKTPSDTLASLMIYDQDIAVAFKAMLVERINRITVLGEESKDFYVMNLAAQAQEMYELGDYDSALRILIYKKYGNQNVLGYGVRTKIRFRS